jgi:hypothetical protein
MNELCAINAIRILGIVHIDRNLLLLNCIYHRIDKRLSMGHLALISQDTSGKL